jgi:virulence-associated protein VagC
MDAAFLIQMLRNDQVSVSARDGRVVLRPTGRVTDRHRDLVRENKAALLAELAKWPNATARARDSFTLEAEPIRADELGREGDPRKGGQQPNVITGRGTWRR